MRLVWTKLGVRSAEDLEAAIADGRFRTLPGMKEKKEARIRRGLEARRTATAGVRGGSPAATEEDS